jgi:hypothetical protein
MPLTKPRYKLSERVGDPKAWSYTWEVQDDVRLESSCGFCGQGEQRLTYEVARGGERNWICQRCVGRYPIGGEIDGARLDIRSARIQIHGLTARLKQQTCQDAIKAAQQRITDTELEEVLVYFQRNLQLSPQRAAILFRALGALDEPVDVRIFEIQTRSIAHQDEYGALPDADRTAVWAALTPIQKRRMISLGYAPTAQSARRRRGGARR